MVLPWLRRLLAPSLAILFLLALFLGVCASVVYGQVVPPAGGGTSLAVTWVNATGTPVAHP